MTTAKEALAAVKVAHRQAQTILGVEMDGDFGKKSQAAEKALRKLARESPVSEWPPRQENAFRRVLASSFADPADVAAFKKCKEKGNSDKYCFRFGDNGIGCWGDDTTGPVRMVALPPDDMIAKWGSVDGARDKGVIVNYKGKEVAAVVGDRMPWKKNIKNGAGMDMNPALCKALGLKPPVMVTADWCWA